MSDLHHRLRDALKTADVHSCGTNDGADYDALADAAVTALPGTCDASMAALVGDPIGPCVLRHGHDGPVHQAVDGAKWWPTP